MKRNLELLKEVLEQFNKTWMDETERGFEIIDLKSFTTILFAGDLITCVDYESIEESDNPIKLLISNFYTYNQRAASKGIEIVLKRNLNGLFKKILKSDDKDEILELVEKCQDLNNEIKELKYDLKYTKTIGKNLYVCKDLWNDFVA
jgi:hypothetical protein